MHNCLNPMGGAQVQSLTPISPKLFGPLKVGGAAWGGGGGSGPHLGTPRLNPFCCSIWYPPSQADESYHRSCWGKTLVVCMTSVWTKALSTHALRRPKQ